MRDPNSATLYIKQTEQVQLAIPLPGCAPMGIEPVTSGMADIHGDQCVTDAHTVTITKISLHKRL